MMNIDVNEIRRLIDKDSLQEALTKLMDLPKTWDEENSAVILNGDFSQLENHHINNTIEGERHLSKEDEIKKRTLKLLDKISRKFKVKLEELQVILNDHLGSLPIKLHCKNSPGIVFQYHFEQPNTRLPSGHPLSEYIFVSDKNLPKKKVSYVSGKRLSGKSTFLHSLCTHLTNKRISVKCFKIPEFCSKEKVKKELLSLIEKDTSPSQVTGEVVILDDLHHLIQHDKKHTALTKTKQQNELKDLYRWLRDLQKNDIPGFHIIASIHHSFLSEEAYKSEACQVWELLDINKYSFDKWQNIGKGSTNRDQEKASYPTEYTRKSKFTESRSKELNESTAIPYLENIYSKSELSNNATKDDITAFHRHLKMIGPIGYLKLAKDLDVDDHKHDQFTFLKLLWHKKIKSLPPNITDDYTRLFKVAPSLFGIDSSYTSVMATYSLHDKMLVQDIFLDSAAAPSEFGAFFFFTRIQEAVREIANNKKIKSKNYLLIFSLIPRQKEILFYIESWTEYLRREDKDDFEHLRVQFKNWFEKTYLRKNAFSTVTLSSKNGRVKRLTSQVGWALYLYRILHPEKESGISITSKDLFTDFIDLHKITTDSVFGDRTITFEDYRNAQYPVDGYYSTLRFINCDKSYV